MDPVVIEKENVGALKFPTTEVLSSPELIEKRAKQLKKALSLGNLDKIKVKIEFEDAESIRVVHTTIWAVTEFNIILKGDVIIPRNRIYRIEFA